MAYCRAVLIVVAFLSISSICTSVFADDNPPAQTLVELIQKKHDYKAAWGTMFKGEYSPPNWVVKLEANSTPVTEIKLNEKDYVVGSMCKENDCAGDRMIVLFSSDHKKAWGLEITVPAGIGKDGAAHPKKYASLQFFGSPDQSMKKNLMGQLQKDPTWK